MKEGAQNPVWIFGGLVFALGGLYVAVLGPQEVQDLGWVMVGLGLGVAGKTALEV